MQVFKILHFVKFLMIIRENVVLKKVNAILKFYAVAEMLITYRSGIVVMNQGNKWVWKGEYKW